jgi:hypothetical protein
MKCSNNLPDFIGLGARKAGTTWLHTQLQAHPDICMAEEKEVHFFTTDKPIEWYKSRFNKCPAKTLKGEITPEYILGFNNIPIRIKKALPNVKLFLIARNPTERAFSQWKFARFLGNVPLEKSFIDCWRSDLLWMRTRGNYANQLITFLDNFTLGENLEVFIYEDLLCDPVNFVKYIYKYLGADETFISPTVDKIVYPLGHKGGTMADYQRCNIDVKLSVQDRNELTRYYYMDTLNLGNLLARNLDNWM